MATAENVLPDDRPGPAAQHGAERAPALLRSDRWWQIPAGQEGLMDGVLFEDGTMLPMTQVSQDVVELTGKIHSLANSRLERILRVRPDESAAHDFSVAYGNLYYRVHYLPDTFGKGVFSIRLLPARLPSLADIFPPAWSQLLSSPLLCQGGLVVITGGAGMGKSTTAATLLLDRLTHLGGVAITIEDPPEYPLHGLHGKGFCVQTDLREGVGFEVQLADALRSFTTEAHSLLLMGELRNAEQLENIVYAACNRHLVVTTLHGSPDIPATLEYLIQQVDSPKRKAFSAALSHALRLVIYQALDPRLNRLGLSDLSLLFSGPQANRVADCLRAGDTKALAQDVQTQTALLEQDNASGLLQRYGANPDVTEN